jgi:7,8-dihydropterin-6-yl-methyl-4-(beta-D-ribofuranosyl)aminobenzene 5'-phosphate synthase
VNVKAKGLVVLTGCGHAGAINTIKQAQELTGVQKIHAVIGGFHLSGPLFEPIIAPTVAAWLGVRLSPQSAEALTLSASSTR